MILVKDTDAKSVNAAILALNDDLDKQVKAVKNNNAGIVEGETYNINISGNSGSSGSVKNALTITSTTGYTAPSTTVYDGSEAKTETIYTPDQAVNKASSPTFDQITASYLFGSLNTYYGAHASFTTNIKAETSSTGKAGVLFVCTTQHSGSATSMGLGIGIITFPYSLGYDQSLNVKWLYANAAGTGYNQSNYWSFSLSSSQYLVATCSSTDGYCSITFI